MNKQRIRNDQHGPCAAGVVVVVVVARLPERPGL